MEGPVTLGLQIRGLCGRVVNCLFFVLFGVRGSFDTVFGTVEVLEMVLRLSLNFISVSLNKTNDFPPTQ